MKEHEKLLWTADELAREEFKHIYLVEPVIPRSGIVFVYGKRGIGKTNWALTLAAALSEGVPLFGRYRTKPSRVLIVQADTPAAIQHERVARARRYVALENVAFHFPRYFNLIALSREKELIAKINDFHPDAIIWDTLRKIQPLPHNEDTASSMVYAAAKRHFEYSTHAFIHHDKKTIADQDKLMREESFSGHGSWLDSADTGIGLSTIGSILAMSWTKHRTCADHDVRVEPLELDTASMLLYSKMGTEDTGMELARRDAHLGQVRVAQRLRASGAVSPRQIDRIVARLFQEENSLRLPFSTQGTRNVDAAYVTPPSSVYNR